MNYTIFSSDILLYKIWKGEPSLKINRGSNVLAKSQIAMRTRLTFYEESEDSKGREIEGKE